MAEEAERPYRHLPLDQLIRLKHEVDTSISYGKVGVNAKTISELHRLSAEDWVKVRSEYGDWYKKMCTFRAVTLYIIAIVGAAVWIYSRAGVWWWIAVAGLLVALYSAAAIVRRGGHQEGYIDGYDAGFERGVNRVLGLSDEEAVEAAEMATEIQVDENMVRALDKRSSEAQQG